MPDYMCVDCHNAYPESYVYWIARDGTFICAPCRFKDEQARHELNMELLAVRDVVVANNINDSKAMMYILEGMEFRAAKSPEEWAKFMGRGETDPLHRHVALDVFMVNEKEFCNLSTVFLGIDHNFSINDIPILFESMIFGGGSSIDETQERYASWARAATGHLFLCNRILDIISRRHKASSYRLEETGKLTTHYFQLELDGLVTFTKDDIRLIRED